MRADFLPHSTVRDDIDAVREAFRVRPVDRIASLFLALAAWALMRLWAYPSPYPGDSTLLAAQFAGTALTPIYCPPLWALVCRAVARVAPSADVFVVAQSLAQLCVAAAAGLLHASLVRMLLGLQTEESDVTRTPLACRLAAAAATLLFMAFPPVWQAAQMALPEALGLLLAALVARLAVAVAAADDLPPAAFLAFCAVSGAGLAESGVAVLVVPFAVLFLLTANLGIERMGFDSELLQGGAGGPGYLPPPPMQIGLPADDEGDGPGGAALVPLGVLLAVAAAFACLLAALHLNTAPSDPIGLRFSDLASGITAPFRIALMEPTLRGAAVLFILPAVAMVAMGRRQLSGDGGIVETLACALLACVLLTQVSRGGLSAWSLSSSHAIQAGLALPAATAFAVASAALLVRGIRAWRERFAPLEADGRDDGWDDPGRAPPERYKAAAVCCLTVGGLALVLPVFFQLFNREPATRETLSALDAYEHALAADIAPCRYFLSDGVHDVGLRRIDRDLLPVQNVSGMVIRRSRFRRESAVEDYFASSSLSFYERSLLVELGWRALFNDWIANAPSNIAHVAAQTGDECWQDLLRHGHPDWMPERRGLVLRSPLLPAPEGGFSDASQWRERLAGLPAVADPALTGVVRDTLGTLDGLDTLTAAPVRADSRSPMEFLGDLATAEGREEALRRDPANLRARLSEAVHHAVDAVAADESGAAAEIDRTFDAIREGAPPATVRLCDMVQALVDIRLRRDTEAALARLSPYDYDEVLDPPFWYVWGVCGQEIRNEYNVMHAYEMLDKFPERRILRYELAGALARDGGDAPAEIAAIRSSVGILPDDLFLQRRILAVQCIFTPRDIAAAVEHADRLLRRDAEYPLAHAVYAARLLLELRALPPGSALPRRIAETAIEHIVRARRFLPPPHRRLDTIVASLSEGRDPGVSDEGAYALVLDIARFCAMPNTRERLAYETALLMQHHDALAQNSRYLIDPMLELQRQLHPDAEINPSPREVDPLTDDLPPNR